VIYAGGGGGGGVEEETFRPLFSDCPTTKNLKEGFLRVGFPEWLNLTDEKWLELWFFGKMPESDELNSFILLVTMLCNLYIWELKLRKNRGSVAGMLNEVLYLADGILRVNRNFSEQKNKLNYNLCRLL
jgi:hypothetical protein